MPGKRSRIFSRAFELAAVEPRSVAQTRTALPLLATSAR